MGGATASLRTCCAFKAPHPHAPREPPAGVTVVLYCSGEHENRGQTKNVMLAAAYCAGLLPLAPQCAGAARHPTPRRHAVPLMISPGELWAAYEAAADTNSLLTDIGTVCVLNTVSDTAAQLTESQLRAEAGARDLMRTGRFFAFGVADGALSHVWFEVLDATVGDDGTVVQTLLKVAGDALVYTPLWCVWFLAAFVVLEGRPWRSIPAVIGGEWLELFRGNLGFFLPLTGLIYGFVPRDERVLAFAAASLVYTALLSLWNSARPAGADGDIDELCDIDGEDCVALPRPPRAAAALSVGVRRALVTARRRVRPRT